MTPGVRAAISFEDVGTPLVSPVLTEAVVDGGVETLDFRAGWVATPALVSLMTEVDDVSWHARDEVLTTAGRDGAAEARSRTSCKKATPADAEEGGGTPSRSASTRSRNLAVSARWKLVKVVGE